MSTNRAMLIIIKQSVMIGIWSPNPDYLGS